LNFIVVKMKSLQELILIGPERILRRGELLFTSTITGGTGVFWMTTYDKPLKKFIKMNDDFTIETTDTYQHGFIPIVDVVDILITANLYEGTQFALCRPEETEGVFAKVVSEKKE